MRIPLFNFVASRILKKRINQIEDFIKFPVDLQHKILSSLLVFAKDTEIGKKYEFSTISNYKTFCERVPIVEYEEIASLIDRSRKGETNIFWPTEIKWFAKSSGTTNDKSKYIPVSVEALENCHYKAGKDLLSIYFNNNPNSNLFKGKSLRLGGSQELYQNSNNYFGDLSAIIINNLPFWVELSTTPSQKVSLIPEWEKKLRGIITESLKVKVSSLTGVPSWMMVLLNKMLEVTKKDNIQQIWPSLEAYFHGGVSFKPYVNQYEKFFPKKINYYEIYNASEGFFAIQDRNDSDELLLMLDYGIFYEFQSLTPNAKTIPLEEVELGVQYALIITTNAGLWRYKIGDIVKFTSLDPFRIQIVGRTKHYINVFGEELMIENAEKALANVSPKHQVEIVDYTVAPIYMSNKTQGGHEWLIEFKNPPENPNLFIAEVDAELKKLNSDYEAKRYNDLTMKMPTLHIAKPKLFYNWLSSIGKLGGQHKVPRLANDRKFMDLLLERN